jgi:hypothetical protein
MAKATNLIQKFFDKVVLAKRDEYRQSQQSAVLIIYAAHFNKHQSLMVPNKPN